MDVHGDGARRELEIRLGEGTRNRAGIPAEIERAIRHRITVGKNLRRVLVDERNADLVQLVANFRQPLIADTQTARGSIVRTVDISAAPEPGLFGFDGIGDHPAYGRDLRRVEPANQEQRRVVDFGDGFVALKIRIGQRPEM